MDYGAQQVNAATAYAQQERAYQGKLVDAPKGDSQPTLMSASHMEMDEITNHIARNTMMLRELRDRLFGAQPEKSGSASTPRPVPNGSVQLLAEKVEAVKTLLRDQTALVAELQRVG